jgi:multiple antibiotic resistance protein
VEFLFAGVLEIVLIEVAALFPIVNPVGTAPIFLGLTRGASVSTRTTLARRIAVNGFILLVASMLVGSYILAFFGISLPVVQVAGGLVLTATGWSLLTRPPGETNAERTVPATHRDWLQFLLLCIGVQILANGVKALELW